MIAILLVLALVAIIAGVLVAKRNAERAAAMRIETEAEAQAQRAKEAQDIPKRKHREKKGD